MNTACVPRSPSGCSEDPWESFSFETANQNMELEVVGNSPKINLSVDAAAHVYGVRLWRHRRTSGKKFKDKSDTLCIMYASCCEYRAAARPTAAGWL